MTVTLYVAAMKYHLPIATAIIALSISAQAQAKKEPLRLKQTSQWNVDYANERCRLIRKFGEGEELAYIVFDRFGPGDKFRLTVAGKSLKTSIDHGEAIVQFGPTEGEQRLSFSHGSFGELPALLFDSQTRVAPPSAAELAAIEKAGKDKDAIWIDLAPVDPARLGAIRNLTIGRPFRQTVVLETGSMQKPLEALGKCVDDLMTTWGIDVEKHKALSKVATPASSPGPWILSRKKCCLQDSPPLLNFA
jgi:hypothetical protein